MRATKAAVQTAGVRRQHSTQGYSDGYAKREKRWDSPAYRTAHARGLEARKQDDEGST